MKYFFFYRIISHKINRKSHKKYYKKTKLKGLKEQNKNYQCHPKHAILINQANAKGTLYVSLFLFWYSKREKFQTSEVQYIKQ